MVASFTYVTAQINGTGTVAARALQIPFEVGVWIGLANFVLFHAWWHEIVMDTGCAIYCFNNCLPYSRFLDVQQAYGLIPHLAQFDAVSRVQELEGLLGVKASNS